MTPHFDGSLFPYQDLLGFRILDWCEGAIRLGLAVGPRHLDRDGRLDRGVQVALLDAATGLGSCHCAVPGHMRRVVTLNLSTQFLAPARTSFVTAHGRIVQRDGKLVLGEAELRAGDETLLAQASARMRYVGGSEAPHGHPDPVQAAWRRQDHDLPA